MRDGPTLDLALCMSLKPAAHPAAAEDVAELDDAEVRSAVMSALRQLGSVRLWDVTTMLPADIACQCRPDLILNLAEGRQGAAREAQAACLFEWLDWPYTGSDAVTLALTLDKWYTKCALQAAGIATPRGMVLHHPLQALTVDPPTRYIVKPVAEGSGKGIYETNVGEASDQLPILVNRLLARFQQPVVLEEFLPGREFTIAVMGNTGQWEVLPIVEINFEALRPERYPIFGYQAKWGDPSPDDLICPARLDQSLRLELESLAIAACEAVRIRDWARVDVRLSSAGTAHVLEINALPGILPGTGDISAFTLAAFTAGMSYEQMIHRLIQTALLRYQSPGFLSYRVPR